MSGLFDGLEKFGIKLNKDNDADIYKEKEKAEGDSSSGPKEIKPEDIVFLKDYNCPCCDKAFQNSALKNRMIKYVESDTDLRMYFAPLDPLYYDVVFCPHCGYAALSSLFSKLLPKQAERILQTITPNFQATQYNTILTLEEAIERYKMALFSAHVKEGRNGEKAYLCLKLAWLYRAVPAPDQEKAFLENASKGFAIAFEKDSFPICGLDETTLTYIMADMSRRLGDNDAALRFLGRIVGNSAAPQKIKDKAFDLRTLIRDEQLKAQRKANAQAEAQNPAPQPAKKSIFGILK